MCLVHTQPLFTQCVPDCAHTSLMLIMMLFVRLAALISEWDGIEVMGQVICIMHEHCALPCSLYSCLGTMA